MGGGELVVRNGDSLVLTSGVSDVISEVTHDLGIIGKLISTSTAVIDAARKFRMSTVQAALGRDKKLTVIQRQLEPIVQAAAFQNDAIRASLMLEYEKVRQQGVQNTIAKRELELRYHDLAKRLDIQQARVAFDMTQLKREAAGAEINIKVLHATIESFTGIINDKSADRYLKSQAIEAAVRSLPLLAVHNSSRGRISAGIIETKMQIPDYIIK